MAAELEKLARQFEVSGNKDIAKGLSKWARTARIRGIDTFQSSSSPIAETVSFLPEGTVRLPDIQTVGMSNGEMERLADATRGLNLGAWGRDILKRAPTTSKEHQTMSPVALDARTMGLHDDYPTTKQIWEKAKKFGDRVSVEAMVKLAVEAAKGNVTVEIGKPLVGIMEPVTDSRGDPRVLCIRRDEDGLWLNASYANPVDQWTSDHQFVVSSRK